MSSISCFTCPTGAIDRRARPKLRDVVPDTVVTVAVTVDRHRPPPPHRPRAPYQIYTSDETGDLISDVLQRAQGLPAEAAAGRASVATCRARSGSTTTCCRWCIPTASSTEADLAKLPLVEPVYPLTEGLSLNQVRRAVDAALDRVPDIAGMAGPELGGARALSGLRRARCASCTDRRNPPICRREGLAWSRLAYDEFLAGQLALALVRAHLRRPAGPRDALAPGTCAKS